MHHEEDVHLLMKVSSSISTIQGGMEVDQSRGRHEEPNPEVKTVEGKCIERGVNNLLREKCSCQTDGSAMRDCGLQANPDGQVKRNDVVVIGEERREAEPSTVSTYRTESGEVYAEDVDQHMAILPEVIIPATEISLEDIQVVDPGEPLSSDQEKLQQLIWANHHLLVGKGNALTPAARGSVSDIDVGDATRSHKRYDR